ncbi:disintegrin and metalloproteinase domain-containing protein 32-like [Mycteria americana]|uniref:disintegrin and metalloproteinase domain-containing protein 32-like n=1 Tax=Mycteria americana TaxID=33587 RepID=UPI003F585E13
MGRRRDRYSSSAYERHRQGSIQAWLLNGHSSSVANVRNKPLSAAAQSPKYFKVYVVLDKALYNYMGSDTNAATQKIIQVFNLVNNMFNPLNVTIVLSSLELWTEENKISTAGEADDLLQRFLQWKQSYLALRSYDIAYLLVYRDRAAFVGATAPGKACQRNAAGAVAVGKRSRGSPALSSLQYQGAVTLESFSVLLAQLLGRSLGMSYDGSRGCRCPGRVCLMSPEALRFSGAKAFSSCSIRDFETFLKHNGGACLFKRPRLTGLSYRRAAVCGNGVVEPGEQCDCGAAEACLKDKCCTKTCRFKPGVKCSSGLCCNGCQHVPMLKDGDELSAVPWERFPGKGFPAQLPEPPGRNITGGRLSWTFKQRNSQCRPPADAQCDLAEFCNGSSASCPPDLYVQDGHGCEHGTGYCYKGRCQSPDLQCRQLYGQGSKNAPVACYEELNSQRDRFGHCGFQPRQGFKSCAWRYKVWFWKARMVLRRAGGFVVRICCGLFGNGLKTRFRLIVYKIVTLSLVCNNKRQCHCHPGWKPPDCLQKGSHLGGSIDSGLQPTDGG